MGGMCWLAECAVICQASLFVRRVIRMSFVRDAELCSVTDRVLPIGLSVHVCVREGRAPCGVRVSVCETNSVCEMQLLCVEIGC